MEIQPRKNEKFRNRLEENHPGSLVDFEALFTKPFWQVIDVARKHSISRQRAQQIFRLLFKNPYQSLINEKKEKVKKEIACWVFNPYMIAAESKGRGRESTGAVIMALEECKKLGYNHTFEQDGHWYDFKINGWRIAVKSASFAVGTYLNKKEYFHCSLTPRQKPLTDFVLFYIYPKKCFYVIPNKSGNFWIKKNVEEPTRYKNAWHLLQKEKEVPSRKVG